MVEQISPVVNVIILFAICMVISAVYVYKGEKDKEYEHRRAERYKRRCHEIKEGDPIWKIRG